MAKKRREVGKGIRALLANIENEPEEKQESVVKELAGSTANIPIAHIVVNPYQPRQEFEEQALNELSQSIGIHGLIQPITLRRIGKDKYQIISGERRFRASQLAGLTEVPAYVRLVNDQEMIEMALVENIQRENLNAVEVAITYQRLIEECKLTHESLSQRIGKSRTDVTNHLRLLKLPPEILQSVRKKELSMGHARVLAGVDDLAFKFGLYRKIISEGLSVRKTEQLANEYKNKEKKTTAAPKALSIEHKSVQDRISRHFGAKTSIKLGKDGKGQIVLNFNNDDDLNRILDII
ncbi:MAG: ParB/RepB/Spo0J family partition protein, partial [Saprospiraceae bacterium]